TVADRNSLEAAEGRAEALQARDDLVERRTEAARQRRSGECVVDVVETRNAETNPVLPRRSRKLERDRVEPMQLDPAGDDVERRPSMAARRTAVGPEVSHVD